MALFLAMCGFSLAMSISPGPVNLMCASSGLQHGFLRTLPFVSGATIGFTLLLIATGLGITKVVQQLPRFSDILLVFGCLFIGYLGVRVLISNNEVAFNRQGTPGFWEGFLLQWLNPKAWAACVAGISLFSAGKPLLQLGIFASIYFSICFASIAAWALIGDKAALIFNNQKRRSAFNILMGGSLIAIALYLAIQAIYPGALGPQI